MEARKKLASLLLNWDLINRKSCEEILVEHREEIKVSSNYRAAAAAAVATSLSRLRMERKRENLFLAIERDLEDEFWNH